MGIEPATLIMGSECVYRANESAIKTIAFVGGYLHSFKRSKNLSLDIRAVLINPKMISLSTAL